MRSFLIASLVVMLCAQLFITTPLSAQYPTRYDWRDYGKVTSVKSQYPFGTCWAHASIADIESKVLIRENLSYDFSEANLVTCNLNFGGAYQGGIVNIAINYLSVWGTVLEACDPYPGSIGGTIYCKNDTCDYYKVVTEWRKIEGDRNAIKQAILDYGPVQVKAATYTQYDAWYNLCMFGCPPGYCTFDDNFIPNHNMLIVGWDDTLCTSPRVGGGWLVKNSAGTAWGDDGYVYMGYDYGSILGNVSVITDYKDWDPDETVYFLDEHGWMDQTGYGDGVDWAMVEVDPTSDGWLHAVNLWAVTSPLTYNLYIFGGFDGYTLTDQLTPRITGTLTEAGYYTIDLPHLIELSTGDPAYIVMKLDGHGYSSPVPIDNTGPMETGKSYMSNSGAVWEATDFANHELGDIGIRGRATTSMDRGDHGFYNFDAPGPVYASPGQTVSTSVIPANFGSTGNTPCDEPDSFCMHCNYVLPQGFTVTGDPAFETPIFLEPAAVMFNDILISVPCSATPGSSYSITVYTTYWENGECIDEHLDCADPNIFLDTPFYSTDTITLEIVEGPAPFQILGEPNVVLGVDIPRCGIRFDIRNDDSCDSPCNYEYLIVSNGLIGDPFYLDGTLDNIPVGETGFTFASIDTRGATIGDTDTLTMLAWRTDIPSPVDSFVCVVEVDVYSDVEEELPELPASFALEQNYPNPFNPVTEIAYALPEGRNVLLKIFDVSGRQVAILVNGFQEAGYRSVTWNGTDSRGVTVSSGVYFYQIIAGDWNEQKKMILLR